MRSIGALRAAVANVRWAECQLSEAPVPSLATAAPRVRVASTRAARSSFAACLAAVLRVLVANKGACRSEPIGASRWWIARRRRPTLGQPRP